jgi:hypothetical protein
MAEPAENETDGLSGEGGSVSGRNAGIPNVEKAAPTTLGGDAQSDQDCRPPENEDSTPAGAWRPVIDIAGTSELDPGINSSRESPNLFEADLVSRHRDNETLVTLNEPVPAITVPSSSNDNNVVIEVGNSSSQSTQKGKEPAYSGNDPDYIKLSLPLPVTNLPGAPNTGKRGTPFPPAADISNDSIPIPQQTQYFKLDRPSASFPPPPPPRLPVIPPSRLGWEADSGRGPQKQPVLLNDAVGRKFIIPWDKAKRFKVSPHSPVACFPTPQRHGGDDRDSLVEALFNQSSPKVINVRR